MRGKTLLVVFVWILAASVGINLARNVASGSTVRWPWTVVRDASTVSALSGQPPITPYTVVFNTSPKAGAPGPENRTSIKLMALRSDGSVVRQLEVVGGRNPMSSRLIEFASGMVVTTNDILERKHTPGTTASVPGTLRDPRARCLKTFAGNPPMADEEPAGEEEVAGYRMVKVRLKRFEGSMIWLALDLGCAELKTRYVHPSGDVILQTATRVIPGEPEPSLFEVPPHYADVSRERLDGR